MPKKYPEADRGEVGNQGLALLWMAARFFWKSSVLWEFMGVWQTGGNCPVLLTVALGLQDWSWVGEGHGLANIRPPVPLGMVVWHSGTWHWGSFCKLLPLFSSKFCSWCSLYLIFWVTDHNNFSSGYIWARFCLTLLAPFFWGKLLLSPDPWSCGLNEDCHHFTCP